MRHLLLREETHVLCLAIFGEWNAITYIHIVRPVSFVQNASPYTNIVSIEQL